MWNDRRERKLPPAILRRRPAKLCTRNPDNRTDSRRNRVKPGLVGPRPTFSGAQDWVYRHRSDIDTVVQLLDLYPNLIQTEGLDSLWDFLQPVFRENEKAASSKTESYRKDEGRTRKKTKGRSHHGGHHRSRHSNPSSSDGDTKARYVYVCDTVVSIDISPADKSTKERIVTALSSYCYVRTNPEVPASHTDLAKVVRAVSTADAFLFLLNDESLSNWSCLQQLGIAVAYDIPIVTVREAAYSLPDTLSSEFDQLEIVKPSINAVPSPRVARRQHVRSKSSDTWHETRAKSESQSSGFHSDSENLFRRPPTEEAYTLSDVIRHCFQTSVLYVPNFHDSCIAKLLGRLSDYLGDIFLDAEVSKTGKQGSRDSQSTDSETSDRLPDIKGSSVFRTLSSHRDSNRRSTERTSSSDGSHEPPDTPSSTDKSTTTPALMSPPVKLPPINTAPKSEGPPTQSDPHLDVKQTTMKTTPNYASLFISPPSSPFLQTRYLVFPGNTKGPAKKPYLVTFPGDVYSQTSSCEEKERPQIGKDDAEEKEQVEISFLRMDDDPSFDKINLDEGAISEKSPFSTPLPSARRPRVADTESQTLHQGEKRTTKGHSQILGPPRAADRGDRFHPQNGKIRGLQLAERSKQTQVTPPARKYLRNNPNSNWLTATGPFDKKNFKMTKVTLQYNRNGKLPNPLI